MENAVSSKKKFQESITSAISFCVATLMYGKWALFYCFIYFATTAVFVS